MRRMSSPKTSLTVMMVLLMPSLHKKKPVRRDSGYTEMKWYGKWINSPENSLNKTIWTPWRLLRKSTKLPQEFIPGNSSTNPSHSQELEDIQRFKKTWTCLSISKMMLTWTFQTPLKLINSSESLPPSKTSLIPNITMENSMTPPILTQEMKLSHTGEQLKNEKKQNSVWFKR